MTSEWEQTDEIWMVTWWGSIGLNEDNRQDKIHTIPVYCDTPEEAISAVRKYHDSHAIFKRLRAVFPLEPVK